MLPKWLLCLGFTAGLNIARDGLGQRWFDPISCPSLVCGTLPDGLCSQGNATLVEVQACPPLHLCTQGLCTLPETPSGLPGDFCVADQDCDSGKCAEHRCVGRGFQEKCKHTAQCDQGFYCNNNICWKQMSVNSRGCKSDHDCENGSGCGIGAGKGAICLPHFSAKRYEWVADCVNYFSRLCESGSCFAPGGTGRGVCIDPIQSDPIYLYAPCKSHLDCDSIAGEFTFYGQCQCGGNSEGRKYCAPFPGDPPGKHLVSLLQAWYNSTEIQQCHTLRRESETCISHWARAAELMSAYYAYEYSAVIEQAERCVVEALFPDYVIKVTAGEALVAAICIVLT